MILFLDNHILPNVSPDLSDLLQLFIRRDCRVYRNIFIDKFELSTKWKVPFIEFKANNDSFVVITGYYDFESIKRGNEIKDVDDWHHTIYDFNNCPRNECPIYFEVNNINFRLVNVDAKFNKIVNKYTEGSFTGELYSYTMEFEINNQIVKICSDDLIHRLTQIKLEDYEHKYEKLRRNIYYSENGKIWIDYNDAKTFFELNKLLQSIGSLINDGLKVEHIDFKTFGYIYENNKIISRFKGFLNSSDFLYAIICSKVYEENGNYILRLSEELTKRMIPFYKFLLESILNSKICSNNYLIIDKEQFEEIDSIIPHLILNIMRNNCEYSKKIRILKTESDVEYSNLIEYKPSVSSTKFNSLIKDILKIEATHTYSVLYRTGDRDDYWWEEEKIDLSFSTDIDKVTAYAISCSNPKLKQDGNSFHFYKERSGSADRSDVGYDEDYSEEYRKICINSLCYTIFNLYKSGYME